MSQIDNIMNTEQPLALKLADALKWVTDPSDWESCDQAANELRRLHAENEAAHRVGILQEKELMRLEAENKALREALEEITSVAEQVDGWQSFPQEPIDIARAALARAGEKA